MESSNFSQRFNEALEKRNISAAELSQITKIPESAISNYRKGTYEPKQRRLDLIAQTLDVSTAWLMGYDVELTGEKKEPAQSADQEEDLAVLLDEIRDRLKDDGDISFDGKLLSAEGARLLLNSLDLIENMAKSLAEERDKKG